MGNSEFALMAAESWEKSIPNEKIEKYIKSIDAAIASDKDGDATFLIDQKIIILKAVEQRAYSSINDTNLKGAIDNIRLYLECNKYIVNNETFIDSAYNLLLTLLEKSYVENNEVKIVDILSFIEEGVEYISKDLKAIVLKKRKKYISKYLKNTLESTPTVEKGLHAIDSLGKYKSEVPKTELQNFKLNLLKKFKAYNEVADIIKNEFKDLYKSKEGKIYLDLCKDVITSSNDEAAIENLKKTFKDISIPIYYINKSFAKSFNEKFMLSYFHKSIEVNRFSQSGEAFNCIEKYFNTNLMQYKYVLKYLTYTKDLEKGKLYIESILNERGFQLDIIVEECNFIKDLASPEEAINNFVKRIFQIEEKSDINLLCAYIEKFELYYMDIYEDDGWLDLLTDLKSSYYILNYALYIYKTQRILTKESLLLDIIENPEDFDVKSMIDACKAIDYYFKILNEEYISFSKELCSIKQYDKALAVLDLIQDYEHFKLEIQNQKLEINIAEGDGNRIVNVCEKIIEITGGSPEPYVINIYYKTLLKLKHYDKLIRKGEKQLTTYRAQLTEKEKSKIDSYMAKALLKSGRVFDFNPAISKFIYKSRIANYINKLGSKNLILASSMIIVGLLILQYVLFSIGIIPPLKTTVSVDETKSTMNINDKITINPQIEVFPSYANIPELRIESDKPSVIEVNDSTLIARKEGSASIKIYNGNKILYELTKKVNGTKEDTFKVKYEEDLVKVGDEITLEIESNKDTTPVIKSSNEKVVKVINKNKLKAVGAGSVVISIEVGEEVKTINFNITKSNNTSNDDYVIKDSSSRKLTEEDIQKIDKDKLAYARNEIYARNGYIFNSEPYKSYFEKKSWYKGTKSNFTIDDLSEIEQYNIRLIQKFEEN